MRLRKKWWARPELERDNKAIFNPSQHKGKWKELFGNKNPIHLELGCGRGRFINELAGSCDDTNYLAIDVYEELLVYVLRKANEGRLNNLKVIPMNIGNIEDIFAPDEIEKLYINFCNPWPNKRHHKRRLTHPNFLRRYQTFLLKGGEIWFKTDSELLFADSLEYFKTAGFKELYRTYDLHQSDFNHNIMTEYEEKFCNQGIKIMFGRFINIK
ncbi:tRNA (guanine-N(7)-)-methyltransferase [Desulfosporosinus acidiphilus SJ4]|uniref:tRNA (guanine-N(7)-)-methyltransferase n=1 Tax=Desulfosporosinus acidiphilus (strain DSM 22704 / JCM 16185 / SJ4) TaxID=646529 RepID=I4D0X9_DESAJ|nr:tRNA (guanosine(46)-N7)-methyltransferase TrmB [Desulfosporosinus acidiphilus]AFM39453.1 tRNA (guanine-N(7)-)-methyltransferase [Desulfosporosinus acidiphilus SJ4]